MNNSNELENALMNWGKTLIKGAIHINGTIHSVDESSFTCQVDVSTTEFPDLLISNVPLKVLFSSQASVIEIPKLKTACLICFRDNNIQRPQLLSVHESDKYLITIGTSTLEITSGLFKFNGGNNDGMVLINALTTKINNLETLVNNILAVLKATVIPLAPSGTYPFASLYAAYSALSPTHKSDIENTQIKQ